MLTKRDATGLSPTSVPASAVTNERRVVNRVRLNGILYVLPAASLVILVVLFPFGFNVALSFEHGTVAKVGGFVGLRNYIAVLTTGGFLELAVHTLVWTGCTVVGLLVLGLAVALLLNLEFPGRAVVRGAVLAPFALSTVVVVFVWAWLLNNINGVINYFLTSLGLVHTPVVFLANGASAMATVVVIAIWNGAPLVILFLLAGLQAIPKQLYEAARIDGAGIWKEFRYVTFPQLRPFLVTIALFEVIWTFNRFDLIWLLTQGGPANATQTFASAVYQDAFQSFQFGQGAALGIIMFLCLVAIVIPMVRLTERVARQ